MKKLIIILSLSTLPLLQGCYGLGLSSALVSGFARSVNPNYQSIRSTPILLPTYQRPRTSYINLYQTGSSTWGTVTEY